MASSVFRTGWQNVVKDEEAPAYFSQRALWMFSVLFGVLFGSILMSINLNKTESKKGSTLVVCFGLLYFAIEIWALNFIKANSSLTFIFNGVGAMIMQHFFWDKYIGADILYRAKPVWIPSIIGICIAAVLILAIVYGGTSN